MNNLICCEGPAQATPAWVRPAQIDRAPTLLTAATPLGGDTLHVTAVDAACLAGFSLTTVAPRVGTQQELGPALPLKPRLAWLCHAAPQSTRNRNPLPPPPAPQMKQGGCSSLLHLVPGGVADALHHILAEHSLGLLEVPYPLITRG